MSNEETKCPTCGLSALDDREGSIAALDREDIEDAITALSEYAHANKHNRPQAYISITRVIGALAEHLIDRKD